MNNLPTSDLLLALAVLISGLIALLVVRLIVAPKRRLKEAQAKADAIMQRKAQARLTEINDAKDPWSSTCSHDTIQRHMTKSQRLSLEKIGQN